MAKALIKHLTRSRWDGTLEGEEEGGGGVGHGQVMDFKAMGPLIQCEISLVCGLFSSYSCKTQPS